MSRELHLALIDASAEAIRAAEAELTELDQAIGDGDHGANLRRGFDAIAAERDALAGLGLGDALQKAGMTLVAKVGGASGPLYGSLLMGMGKAAKEGGDPVEQLAAGVDMVKRRGKSDVGAKTMLDVLVPVVEALRASGDAPLPERLAQARRVAEEAREATKHMLATRGRASFLGERSRGHYDPGATSSRLLIVTVCDILGAER